MYQNRVVQYVLSPAPGQRTDRVGNALKVHTIETFHCAVQQNPAKTTIIIDFEFAQFWAY